MKDVCELYSLVDVVADRLAATYALQSSPGEAPVQGVSAEAVEYPQMWKEFSWRVIGQQLLDEVEEGRTVARFSQVQMHEGDSGWKEGRDSSMGE